MKKHLQWAVAAGLVLCGNALMAQAPLDAYLTTSTGPNSTVSGVFHVTLPDTNQVQALEVRLGTNEGTQDLLLQTFPYDSNTGLPAGMHWTRTGNRVTLSLGTLVESGVQFGEVRIQYGSGTWSAPYQFVTN